MRLAPLKLTHTDLEGNARSCNLLTSSKRGSKEEGRWICFRYDFYLKQGAFSSKGRFYYKRCHKATIKALARGTVLKQKCSGGLQLLLLFAFIADPLETNKSVVILVTEANAIFWRSKLLANTSG